MLLKRTTLFPYSKGNSSSQSVAAGQQLRRLCREAWQQQSGSSETLYKASYWARRRRRFVKEFDRMLLDRVGSEGLSTILKQMDTRLESWLAADSLG